MPKAASAKWPSRIYWKRYRTYEEMINSPDIDAVAIATPDHWHAPMSIAALQAGKHVYLEKPMTHNIRETYELREAARNSKAVFQVGHQHRQTQSFITAQDIIKKKVLGHVSLLHLKEWLGAIRNGTPVSCGIDEGFEEAMTAHMAGLSWKARRRIEWDPAGEEIIALPGEDLDAVLLATETGEYVLG